ncbi:MAG: serine/threonine-protein kinase [Gemmataceae bacterium]
MREVDLFAAALSLTVESERKAFLENACRGNDALRLRIEQLLSDFENNKSFLESKSGQGRGQKSPNSKIQFSLSDETAHFDPHSEQANATVARVPTAEVHDFNETATHFTNDTRRQHTSVNTSDLIAGRYKLLERIGEGGMGSVWMAEQHEPVKRKVAIKLIKAGMDSRQVLARFDAERQALALMDHPNIAKVLDGGVYQGHPYFVMELVKGVPITEYCDHHKLTPLQRLELFVPVCHAIQHAHQKGIIHRDIKPANVLVALYDDRAIPKVIDFGVAKATGPILTEQTLNTGFGGVIGTPQYMSPEQATFNNVDIDTRSDVYSLGVLLYELLTGSPPFHAKDLERRGLLEILRVVREEEPPRPSTKLSTADALPNLAASRGIEPKKLTGLLKNELDWVVMKALEKDRSRRYESANGFAADVLRYLAGEPVVAHPPSRIYRLRKFVRKNRVPVTAGVAVFLALVAGMTGTVIGLLEAKKQTGYANDAAGKERQAKNIAVTEKQRAIEFRDKAIDALRATTSEDVENLLGEKKELSAKEKAYLEAIARRWQTFAQQEGDDVASQVLRAEGHHCLSNLWRRLSRYEEAIVEARAAFDIGVKLVTESPDNLEHLLLLAKIRRELQSTFHVTGKWLESEEQAREEVLLRVKIAAALNQSVTHQCELAISRSNLANSLAKIGKWTECEKIFLTSMDTIEKQIAVIPDEVRFQAQLANVCTNLGNLYLSRREWSSAEGVLRKGIAVLQKLADDFPNTTKHRVELAMLFHNLAMSYDGLDQWQNAVEQFEKAQAIREKLVADFPAVPEYRHQLALNYNGQGIIYKVKNKLVEGERYYRKSLELQEKLVADFPNVTYYRETLGGAYCNLGATVLLFGKAEEGHNYLDSAIKTLKPLYDKDPRVVVIKQNLKTSYIRRAFLNGQLHRLEEAIQDTSAVIDLSTPDESTFYRILRAKFRGKAGHTAASLEDVKEALKVVEQMPKSQQINIRVGASCAYSMASAAVSDLKEEYAALAIENLKRSILAGFNNVEAIKTEPDMDPIRERTDFKAIMAELEAKFPPDREVLSVPRLVR